MCIFTHSSQSLKLPHPAQFSMHPTSEVWGQPGQCWGCSASPWSLQVPSLSSFPWCWCTREMLHGSHLKATEEIQREGKNLGLCFASVISDHVCKTQGLCKNPKPGKITADTETFEQLRHALDKESCFFSPSPWLACFLFTLFYHEQKITGDRKGEPANCVIYVDFRAESLDKTSKALDDYKQGLQQSRVPICLLVGEGRNEGRNTLVLCRHWPETWQCDFGLGSPNLRVPSCPYTPVCLSP